MEVGQKSVTIEASSETGWHYGLLTLRQLAEPIKGYLPLCRVEDFPDFEHRGVMLDISRDKVPTLETLFYLIDCFAAWKFNELQLYIEHTFAYEGHDKVWQNANPLTKADIHELDSYCHEHFIELVPNLNCFGHMSRWLTHESYRPLAEQPKGGETDFGYRVEPQGLCPTDPRSILLAKDLIHQMVSCFRSRQVNVGCDETIDLGYGRSKEAVEKRGRGRVYLEYLKEIYGICTSENRIMQFWADILLKYPDLIPEIPPDCIALNWGYEAIHPYAKETKCLRESGTPFYVCPGTSSWNSIGGRTENMRENIQSAARHGKQNGAMGFMITDWGDNGHWQPLVSSFPGFVLGASKAWNESHDGSLADLLDTHVFHAIGWGKLLLKIGDLDQPLDIYIHNKSALFAILQEGRKFVQHCEKLTNENLGIVLGNAASLQTVMGTLSKTSSTDKVLAEETEWVIKMLIHSCLQGQMLLEDQNLSELQNQARMLKDQHQYLWQLRNRTGGYLLSRARFNLLTGESTNSNC
jgi:hexosaminidase